MANRGVPVDRMYAKAILGALRLSQDRITDIGFVRQGFSPHKDRAVAGCKESM